MSAAARLSWRTSAARSRSTFGARWRSGRSPRAQLALDLSEPTGRGVTLFVHLSESAVARLDNTDTPVLVDQVAAWCAGAQVTIKPVIDLNEARSVAGYVPTAPIAERARLAWPRCVFPYRTRRARRCDLDHRVPYGEGPTSTSNLAPLCRTHHRMKTFCSWTYEPAATTTDHGVPTAFTWTSPAGDRFRVDQHGSSPEP